MKIYKTKKAPQKWSFLKKWRRHTLPVNPVPSALMSLTSLFGMGRGDPHRNYHHKIFVQTHFLSGEYELQYINDIIERKYKK